MSEKLSKSASNQSSDKSDSPDQKTPYFTYDEVLKNHLSTDGADMEGSVNSRSGEGIMGHGAPGEIHAGKGGHSK